MRGYKFQVNILLDSLKFTRLGFCRNDSLRGRSHSSVFETLSWVQFTVFFFSVCLQASQISSCTPFSGNTSLPSQRENITSSQVFLIYSWKTTPWGDGKITVLSFMPMRLLGDDPTLVQSFFSIPSNKLLFPIK